MACSKYIRPALQVWHWKPECKRKPDTAFRRPQSVRGEDYVTFANTTLVENTTNIPVNNQYPRRLPT